MSAASVQRRPANMQRVLPELVVQALRVSGRERHVVWGAGQVGPQLADPLLTEGHEVRLCSRRPHPGWAHPNLSICAGDATERRFVDEVCRGATTNYNCTNPPYHRWNCPDQIFCSLARLPIEHALIRRLGRFVTRERIGRGGVYRAVDTKLRRAVAIKVPRRHTVKRLTEEARTAALINHPGMATVYSLERSGRLTYWVVEPGLTRR